MKNIFFFALYLLFSAHLNGQSAFCGTPYTTFFSANILVSDTLRPKLNAQPLPLGSRIIAVFDDNGQPRCAGSILWDGVSESMVVNGADGTLPGYQPNERYKYMVQLPDSCLLDSVKVTYDVIGIYTNKGFFADGTFAKLATFQAFQHGDTCRLSSIKTIPNLKNFKVSPNPCTDFLNISISLHQDDLLTWHMHDCFGKNIRSWPQKFYSAGNQHIRFDVDALPNGVYFLEVRSRKGRIVQKIIKQGF